MRIFFYETLKFIAKIGLRLFYPFKVKRSQEYFRTPGPLILISNHPNTLIDPLFVATYFYRRLSFLVNAGLFKNQLLRAILNFFYCIKVERKQDNNGQEVNNENAFEQANLHLKEGGAIYIAPEGTSIRGKKLLPFKTGTARIAKSAFLAMDKGQDLHILPVGLTYRNPSFFGTEVAVMVGAPISIRKNWHLISSNGFEGVRKFTQLLEETVKELVIHCDSEKEEELLDRMMEIEANSNKLKVVEWYETAKKFSTKIKTLREKSPEKLEGLYKKVEDYFKRCKSLGVSDYGVAKKHKNGLIILSIFLGIGFPFFWIGLSNHLIPVGLLVWISRNYNKYVEYEATIQLVGGILLLPFFYFLQVKIIALFLPGNWPIYYLLITIGTGLLAIFYSRWIKKMEQWWAAVNQDLSELERLRKELVEDYLIAYK